MTSVVHVSNLEGAKREWRAAVSAEWRRFPTLRRFLVDHYPESWNRISTCSMEFKTWRDRNDQDRIKLQPITCHEVPFCITCNRRRNNRRVRDTLNNFSLATPAGKQPRFIHIVQTAPLTEDGLGWGKKASWNPKPFARIVWETIKEHTHPGIGGDLSYQAFGERCFQKWHPHIDLTLNGYTIQDGQAIETPRIQLAGGGWTRFQQSLADRATMFDLDAVNWRGSLFVGHPTTGIQAYYKILRYQKREMLDLRKVEYNRERQTIDWLSYKDNARTRFTVKDWKAGLHEYVVRYGPWGRMPNDPGQHLHYRYGHMAKGSINKTANAIGGREIPHGSRCPCMECGDWDRVFADDLTPPIEAGEREEGAWAT